VREGLVKAAKGLIRAEVKVKEGTIESIRLSGDFFLYPPESLWDLERTLIGVKVDASELKEVIRRFFEKNNIKAPFIGVEDFVKAILRGVSVEEAQNSNV